MQKVFPCHDKMKIGHCCIQMYLFIYLIFVSLIFVPQITLIGYINSLSIDIVLSFLNEVQQDIVQVTETMAYGINGVKSMDDKFNTHPIHINVVAYLHCKTKLLSHVTAQSTVWWKPYPSL